MTIDWYGITNEYNDKYGTDYFSEVEMLKGAYEDGNSIDELGEILGVSNSTIVNMFKKHGIKMRNRGYVHSQKQLDFMQFVREGDMSEYTLKELSEKFDLSWDYVRHRVRKAGQKCKKGPSAHRKIKYT